MVGFWLGKKVVTNNLNIQLKRGWLPFLFIGSPMTLQKRWKNQY